MWACRPMSLHPGEAASMARLSAAATALVVGIALTAASGVAAGLAVAPGPSRALVELVDLACAHCRVESSFVPGIATTAARDATRFEIAPVQPAPGAEPSAAVQTYYAEITAHPNQGVAAARALYDGYAQGAALDSTGAVRGWLGMHGIPVSGERDIVTSAVPAMRWRKAVQLAVAAHTQSFPTFVLLDLHTGGIARVFRWHGHPTRLAAEVKKALNALHGRPSARLNFGGGL